jgi:preprotein translocase subunit SecY
MCENVPNMTSPWARVGASLPDVEPYVPFNINPTGMQPVLTTTYLMALPSLVANFTVNGGFWHQLRDMLNPSASGAQPWHYYTINAMLIFIFNILDIVGLHSFPCRHTEGGH